MLKNYWLVAWRNLVNNKVYSALNIAGLATGMAVALLIGLWVVNEFSYDKFLPNSGQIYQVDRKIAYPGWNGDLWSGCDIGLAHLTEPVRTRRLASWSAPCS